MGRDLADEESEAIAALLGSHAGRPRTRTALRPKAVVSAHGAAGNAAPAWLPWAALGAGTAIGVGCITGGVALAGMLAARIWPEGATQAWPVDLLFTATIFVPMLVLALLAARITRVPTLVAGWQPGAMLLLGVSVGLAGIAAATAYAAISGVARPGAGGVGGALILLGSAAMLVQAGTEEVLLRGWMQGAIMRRWYPWAAIVPTALVFAGLHVLGGARSPVELANLALGGVMFGLLRWKSGGLVAPVAAHYAWNWAEALLLGLDPNPGIGSYGAAFDLDLVGPAIWGGSEQGLNGSAAMLLVLVALVVPLALWKPRA